MTVFVESPAPFIHLYDLGDVEPFLNALLDAAEVSDRVDWKRATTGGVNTTFVSPGRTNVMLDVKDLIFWDQSVLSELWTDLDASLWDGISHYCNQYGLNIKRHNQWGLNRYEMGAEYNRHPDKGGGNTRVLSAILYMNPLEGGETLFHSWGTKVSPDPGKMVLFPSSYPWQHSALPPAEGEEKYTMVAWFHAD